MIRAYDEIYLDDAMETLGSAVEYAILFGNVEGQEFLNMFIASEIAEEFGRGNVKYISGMSGIELAKEIFEKCGKNVGAIQELPYVTYPQEYWIGWILAYYQWYTGKSFSTILRRMSYYSILDLYGVLHEADPSKAVETLNQMFPNRGATNLARFRKNRDLSQSQLAKAAGISIRSVQLYEQRQTDINKAQYNHLKSLSKVLGCTIEDLLE